MQLTRCVASALLALAFVATMVPSPVRACGSSGFAVLLRHLPDAIPAGALALEVVVKPRANRGFHRLVRAKLVRNVRGHVRGEKLVIDFDSANSCEFLRATGSPQYLVGYAKVDEGGWVSVKPILYAEKWVPTQNGPMFERMERE